MSGVILPGQPEQPEPELGPEQIITLLMGLVERTNANSQELVRLNHTLDIFARAIEIAVGEDKVQDAIEQAMEEMQAAQEGE